jgi:hypothetical protein
MAIESGVVTLLDLMTLARQEADMVNSQFITEPELVGYIQNSYKDLYNLITTAYGEDYYAAIPSTFTTVANQDKYDLPNGTTTFLDNEGNTIIPPAFYKLLGVDLQLNANNPQGYITLKPFTFSERNRFAVPNFASFWGFTNIRYRLLGNQIWMTPVPMAGQNIRLYYVPRPVNLINTIIGDTVAQSTTITVVDVTTPQVGMNVFGSGILPNTVITAVGVSTITISKPAQGTLDGIPLQMFDYTTRIDGVAGWEEYIIIDTAIKMKDKEESDVMVLAARKAEKKKDIEGIAANRDPGSAARTADVMTDIWNSSTNGNDGYSGR